MAKQQKVDCSFDIKPYDWQEEFIEGMQGKLFCAAVIHRQAGKTELALMMAVSRALSESPDKPVNICYLCPFLSQARRVFWPRLKAFIAPISKYCEIKEGENTVKFPNGTTLYLAGADNESSRGMSFKTIICDEYDNVNAETWTTVFLPTLAAHGDTGSVLFIGTLRKGDSKLYKLTQEFANDPDWHCAILGADDTGVLTDDYLARMKKQMTPNNFKREFYSDNSAASETSVIGDLVCAAEDEGRVREIPAPKGLVYTAWDLGVRDFCAVWVFSYRDDFIVFHNYFEFRNLGLDKIILKLRESCPRYSFSEHYLPWDIGHREISSGNSRLSSFERYADEFNFGDAVQLKRFNVADSIHSTRINLPRSLFNKTGCEAGLKRLKACEYQVHAKTNTVLDSVLHDENSHAFDAIRYAFSEIEESNPAMEEGSFHDFSCLSNCSVIRST